MAESTAPRRAALFTEWMRANVPLLTSLGAAGGLSTPTVWAIQANVEGETALPWSLVAIFVILVLTNGLITLPAHKRELKRQDAVMDRILAQQDKFIDNHAVIIKALEDIQAGNRFPNAHQQRRRAGQDRQ